MRAFSDGTSRTNAFVPTKMTQFQLARDWHFQLTEKTSSTLSITVFCTNYRINTVRNINPMFAVQEIQIDREGADIIVIGYEVGIKRGILDHLASERNMWYA